MALEWRLNQHQIKQALRVCSLKAPSVALIMHVPEALPSISHFFFPLLTSLPLFFPSFALPFPISSRWPALSPSMRSVWAVNPLVSFLFIFACRCSLAFFGLKFSAPFFVIPLLLCPLVFALPLEGALALEGFLICPCAIGSRCAWEE
jgi:hypothetical protein